MNLKLHYYDYRCPGIFSRFMRIIRHGIPYDIDNVYIDSKSDYMIENPFDWIFEQYYDESFIEGEETYNGLYNPQELGSIEKSDDLEKLKLIRSKIKIQKNILDWVENNSHQINENCLGVHVRLGDMNHHHPQHGVATINNYIERIDKIIKEEGLDKVFVASDSNQSLNILHDHFGDVIAYIPDMIRAEEWDFSVSPMFTNLDKKIFWEEAIKEVLLLSKCNQFLRRTSSFADTAIVFSNAFTKIHRL
jgi:hypothetical protein